MTSDERSPNETEGPRDSGQARNVPRPSSARDARGTVAARTFDGGAIDLFVKSMEQTRMAVCLTDPALEDNPIVFANRAFLDLTGYPEEEVIGRNCRFLQGPESDPATVARMRETIAAEDVAVLEVLNYRRDGSRFWNALHLGPIYDEEGALRFFFGSQWDVTDVHAARASEQQAKLLSRELSHRMKNMFSVIGSVVLLTGRRHGAPEVAREIDARIRALGRAYESTLEEASGAEIALAPLMRTVLAPYGAGEEGRIALSGPDLRMDVNAVSTLGLVLHELATNAVKHGALSAPSGAVDVTWERAEADDLLRLDWHERGGPPVREGAEDGLGSEIVGQLLRVIGGAMERDWDAEGLRVSLRLPLRP